MNVVSPRMWATDIDSRDGWLRLTDRRRRSSARLPGDWATPASIAHVVLKELSRAKRACSVDSPTVPRAARTCLGLHTSPATRTPPLVLAALHTDISRKDSDLCPLS